jgi:hypothetical protein
MNGFDKPMVKEKSSGVVKQGALKLEYGTTIQINGLGKSLNPSVIKIMGL